MCDGGARPRRVQYEDAMYHVISRGNYRGDVFRSAGAAKAFEAALLIENAAALSRMVDYLARSQ